MAKFRSSFVTNSSSSSFICEVCGNVEAGMDLCLSEAEFARCVNGHEFCESCVDGDIEERYEVPADQCPICTLDSIDDSYIVSYISKAHHIDTKEIRKEIRDKFKDHSELSAFLKDGGKSE